MSTPSHESGPVQAHDPGPVEAMAERLTESERRYAPDDERPLGSYTGVLLTFASAAAAFGGLVRLTGRSLPERIDARDLALVAVASHRLARLIAKEPVTSPLRAPFTRFAGTSGPSELHEEVRGSGPRKAIGELLTCPFCVGHWVTSAFMAGLVLAPRPTRLIASVYAALAGADLLQYAYSAVQQSTED